MFYVVFLGSPTGLITLVSSLREIPTVAVLHHPFLFGEIPTYTTTTRENLIHRILAVALVKKGASAK